MNNLHPDKYDIFDELMRGTEVVVVRFCNTVHKLRLMSHYEYERIEAKHIYGVDMPPPTSIYQ